MDTTRSAFDLTKVLDVIIAFNSEKNYFDLLKIILLKMMEMTNADAGTLYVAEGKQLHFRIIKNISMNIFQESSDTINLPPVSLDKHNIENISAYAAIKNEIVCIDDVYKDDRFNLSGPKSYDKMTGYHTQSMLVFPLTATNGGIMEVIGVIQLINAIDKETGQIKPFGSIYEPPILQALSNIAANTLANILYAKEIDDLFNSFVSVMTKAIDERSIYNVNHTNNVAKYCERFAVYLSENFPLGHMYYFSDNRRDQLVMAAYLHDIGKIITPLDIMDKMDRLDNQWELIKYRFAIKRCQLENEYLRHEMDLEAFKKCEEELNEALALIESSNTAEFLPTEIIDDIKKLYSICYIDETGCQVPVLTSANIEALTVQRGTLTDAERSIMQEHVSITGRLLENMKFNKYYKNVPKWACGHHEFLNGKGYPLGLKDSEVTIEMCILSIIDIFDALTAIDRPYKKATSAQKAQDIIMAMSSEGKLHDELAKLFFRSRVWETNSVKHSSTDVSLSQHSRSL